MSRIKKADPAFSIGQCFEFRNVLPYSLFLSNFQRGKSVREGGKDDRRHFSTNIENALRDGKEGGRQRRQRSRVQRTLERRRRRSPLAHVSRPSFSSVPFQPVEHNSVTTTLLRNVHSLTLVSVDEFSPFPLSYSSLNERVGEAREEGHGHQIGRVVPSFLPSFANNAVRSSVWKGGEEEKLLLETYR